MRLLVTREQYFDAAMTLLATDGVGKLKIATLCGALNVTTGSFYGYFGSLDGFVAEFLAYWEETQTERLGQLAGVPGDLAARVHLLKRLTAGLPHAAEAAIRGWAHSDAQVAAAQKRVDDRRIDIVTNLLAPAVGSRREAATLAIMGVTLLIGIQQWRSPVTTRDFNRIFNEYEKVLFARMTGDESIA